MALTDKQKRRLMIAIALGAPILGYAVFSSRGFISRIGLEWEKRTLQEQTTLLQRQQDSLRLFIHQLETDTLLLEQLARERYGMIKSGEQVFITDENSKSK